MVEWLQGLVEKREIPTDLQTNFDVGFDSKSSRYSAGTQSTIGVPHIHGLRIKRLPLKQKLLKNPHEKYFDDVDAVVLTPSNYSTDRMVLQHDPNLALVLGAIVTAQTDPQSMSKPIILYNQNQKFGPVLQIVKDAFLKGRLLGDLPFFVANNFSQLREHLLEAQTLVRLSPKIRKLSEPKPGRLPSPKRLPKDGIFTLFIGGGHENNNKQDLEDAIRLGYECAQKGYRIVTGAGSIEGSMGATHTGFIQYHLDQIQDGHIENTLKELVAEIRSQRKTDNSYDTRKVIRSVRERGPEYNETLRNLSASGLLKELSAKDASLSISILERKVQELEALKASLESRDKDRQRQYMWTTVHNGQQAERYDAEKIVDKNPTLLNSIADTGLIPRKMFYGYSMANLLKLENPEGRIPPAITYSDTGNLTRRLHYLLQPGTKIFLSGSVGTDQELEDTIEQHLKARMTKSPTMFSDRTPNSDHGAIIIHNRGGNMDKVLEHYGILMRDGNKNLVANENLMNNYRITVVNTIDDLKQVLQQRANNWPDTPEMSRT